MSLNLLTEQLTINTCKYCEETYNSLCGLAIHIKCVHKPGNEFKCLACGYTTPKKSRFREHIGNTHVIYKEYVDYEQVAPAPAYEQNDEIIRSKQKPLRSLT